jgi:hypothetical protein
MDRDTIYARPRRSGGRWGRLLLVLIVVGGACYGTLMLLAPWSFHMGGGFHLLPYWQGVGRMHSQTAGGDYAIYLYFYPQGRNRTGTSHVAGSGMLCTPRGEQIYLTLGGDFANPGADLNGKSARFYMYDRTAKRALLGGSPQYRLAFKGRWANPDLVMDDDGSLARNFDPQGAPWPKGSHSRPYMGEVVPVTVKQGSKADFEVVCKTLAR